MLLAALSAVNQNVVHIEILDTSFKMTKRKFSFWVVKDVYYESQMKHEYQ